MGLGFQLYIVILALCQALLISSVVALVLAVPIFFISKRLLRHKSANPLKKSLLISGTVAALTLLSSCAIQFIFPLREITSQSLPTENNVIGSWVPTEWPLNWMHDHGYMLSNQRIQFFSDGTFSINSIPALWLTGSVKTHESLFSGGGTWQINQAEDDDWDIALTFISPPSGSVNSPLSIPWIPSLDLIYFPVPGESKQASFQKCGPVKMRLSDSSMDPYRQAISEVDRVSFGFSPISVNTWVELQSPPGEQVWINVFADTSKTILLTKDDNSFQWVFEQEIALGPDTWVDYDGALWQESITIQYQTQDINGGPINRTSVFYTGRDPRLTGLGPLWLNLQDVQPFLEEWKDWRAEQPPDPVDLCP